MSNPQSNPHVIFIPVPLPGASHHVVFHTVGPSGPNGTQQFPKLSDCELYDILHPMIHHKITCVYAIKESDVLNAQNMLANMEVIVNISIEILSKVEKERGYCSCECLRAFQSVVTQNGHACDVVFKALMICMSLAALKIQLKHIRNAKSETDPATPVVVTLPHAPGATAPGLDPHAEAMKQMWEELKQIQQNETELREIIQALLNSK